MTGSFADGRVQPVFEPSEVSVAAGDVTFLLSNVPIPEQELPPAHDFVLSPEPPRLTTTGWFPPPIMAASAAVGVNKSTSLTVSLVAGTYTYWCRIDGHFTSGMIGTLTVTP